MLMILIFRRLGSLLCDDGDGFSESIKTASRLRGFRDVRGDGGFWAHKWQLGVEDGCLAKT